MSASDAPGMREPARVLALVTDAYGRLGGIAQYNRDFLDALEACCSRVRVISLNPIDASRNSSVIAVSHCSGNRLRFVAEVLSTALKERPHVVFCGHINLAYLALRAARLCGARLWLQLHGIDAWQPPGRLRSRGTERSDLVTTVSRYTRERFLSWAGVDPGIVRVLPNTVSERFSPGPVSNRFRANLGLDEVHRPILLTVARLTHGDQYKGMDDVLHALVELRRDYPSIVYLLAGDGDDRQRLEHESRRLGIESNVRFLGLVSDADLPQLYREADLFVMPSRKEGFGIVYLEAMASGTPALGLNQDGSVDALQEGQLGFVCSAERILETMQNALSATRDPERLSSATRNAFGRTNFSRHISDLLDRLIGSGFKDPICNE